MYPPHHFQTDDSAALQAFLQKHYFGLLLSHNGVLHYSPLPFLFDWQSVPTKAYCHMARNNPQLQQLEGAEVSVVIQGPHAFVAASAYEKQPAVSSWNYAIVELRGTARLLNPDDTLALVRKQEAHTAPSMEQAAEYQQQLVNAIVGVEVTLTQLCGRFKLSQNKTADEQQRVKQYLKKTEQSHFVWQMM